MTGLQRITRSLRAVYHSDVVQFTVVAIIIANFLCNIAEYEMMSKEPNTIGMFDKIDLVFTILFTIGIYMYVHTHTHTHNHSQNY